MVRFKVLDAAVNCVTLKIDLQNHAGARIYRARRASGPYEEVGVAFEETYVDTVDLEAVLKFAPSARERARKSWGWRAKQANPLDSSMQRNADPRLSQPLEARMGF